MKTGTKVILLSVVLLGAGGLAYFFLKNKKAMTNVPGTDTTPGLGSNLTDDEDYIDLPSGMLPENNGTGAGSIKQHNEQVETYVPVTTVPVKQDSVRDSYLRSLTMYFTDTRYLTAFNNMSNDELAASWYYVGAYLNPGIPLLNDTKKLPNGQWDNSNPGNPGLFAKITAIRNKYGIF